VFSLKKKWSIKIIFTFIFLFFNLVADRYHPKSAAHNRKNVPSVKNVNPQELETEFWLQKAQNSLNEKIQIVKNENLAKNVIFFLGDGMSVPTGKLNLL
jgi:alkaline phosphatase